MRRKNSSNKKSKPQEAVLTSLGEPTGRWVSRETLAAVAFFRRLEAQEEVPFLEGASGDFSTDCGAVLMYMTAQLGTPRGRYDEHSSKFSLSKKPRFIELVGESQT
jgi:hypothetical protein